MALQVDEVGLDLGPFQEMVELVNRTVQASRELNAEMGNTKAWREARQDAAKKALTFDRVTNKAEFQDRLDLLKKMKKERLITETDRIKIVRSLEEKAADVYVQDQRDSASKFAENLNNAFSPIRAKAKADFIKEQGGTVSGPQAAMAGIGRVAEPIMKVVEILKTFKGLAVAGVLFAIIQKVLDLAGGIKKARLEFTQSMSAAGVVSNKFFREGIENSNKAINSLVDARTNMYKFGMDLDETTELMKQAIESFGSDLRNEGKDAALVLAGYSESFNDAAESSEAMSNSLLGTVKTLEQLFGMNPTESINTIRNLYETINVGAVKADDYIASVGESFIDMASDAGRAGMDVRRFQQNVISTTQSTAFFGTQLSDVSELMSDIGALGGKFKGAAPKIAEDIIGFNNLDIASRSLVGQLGNVGKWARLASKRIDEMIDSGKLSTAEIENWRTVGEEINTQLQKGVGGLGAGLVFRSLPVPEKVGAILEYLKSQQADLQNLSSSSYSLLSQMPGMSEELLQAMIKLDKNAGGDTKKVVEELMNNTDAQDSFSNMMATAQERAQMEQPWEKRLMQWAEKFLLPIAKGVSFLATIADKWWIKSPLGGAAARPTGREMEAITGFRSIQAQAPSSARTATLLAQPGFLKSLSGTFPGIEEQYARSMASGKLERGSFRAWLEEEATASGITGENQAETLWAQLRSVAP